MKNNKGFTLIELLVVVAIIGILAAVGTVAYSGYVFSSKLKSADNIMQQIALAQTEYYSDIGNYKNYGKSCTANKDNTELITTDLGVPIDYSTIEFYLIRCDPEGCFGHEGVATPIKIGTATIKNRCGSAKWGDGGVMSVTDETVTIKAGDGIGMFVKSNNDVNGNAPTKNTGSLHSPATFTLEVHRKY